MLTGWCGLNNGHVCLNPSLTNLVKNFCCTPKMDQAFKPKKAIMAAEVFMAYPKYNVPFNIYTNTSDYQTGGVIVQLKQPVAYWSKKQTYTRQKYKNMENEILSIIMIFETSQCMLLGTELFIYTSHINITFSNWNCCYILHWCSHVEEYGPTILYHPCKIKYHCQYIFTAPVPWHFANASGGNAPVVLSCKSASSTYHNPMLQRTTLLTLDGWMISRVLVLNLQQKQSNTMTTTSTR